MLRAVIGVTAHNEARNLGRLLERLRTEDLGDVLILRITVVASGCTDDTVAVAQRARSADDRLTVIVDPERQGKAVAINQLLATAVDADIIVMESADTLPDAGSLRALVSRFTDPAVGMVGARPVPEDDEATFVGFAVQLLWRLHHAIASRSPKQGELVAWRNVVPAIPDGVTMDEAYLESAVRAAGYTLAYEPRAVVRNRGPATVGALVTQRRRNHAGHRALAATVRYRPSTRDHGLIARLAVREVLARPSRVHWLAAAAAVELWASILGLWDHRIAQRDHVLWDVIEGTKALAEPVLERLPTVLVLIVTYNGRDDLLECLASVMRQRYTSYDVLVVDNAGWDGTPEAVAEAYPGVDLVRMERNLGLASGFNAGLATALAGGYEYLLLLNDDLVIAPDFIEEAVAVASAEPRAASITGPVFYYYEPERLWYAGAEILWWLGKTFHRGRKVLWGPAFRVPRRLGYATGAAALYRTAALRAVGGWDEEYFLVFEDSDWSVRASRAGWYHRYVPGPKAWRRVPADADGQRSPVHLYFLFRNNIRFMRKHARLWHWPTFLAFFAVESLARYSLTALFSRQRAAHLLAIRLAVADALRGRWRAGSSGAVIDAVAGGVGRQRGPAAVAPAREDARDHRAD